MRIDYSIIIPAFNEENYLPQTLCSVKEAMSSISDFKGEIIVVNNASTDKTGEIAKSFDTKVIFEEVHNIGRVRNTGAKHAQGEFLIFLDADTTLTGKILERTLNVLTKENVIGGSSLVKLDCPLNKPLFFLAYWLFFFYCLIFSVGFGSYIFCRKSSFNDINGFDESYYATEDIIFFENLKKNAKKNNLKLIFLKTRIIVSGRKIKQFKPDFEFIKGACAIFFNKNYFKNKENCKYWYQVRKKG